MISSVEDFLANVAEDRIFPLILQDGQQGLQQGGTVRAAFELNVPVELCSAPAASDAITAPLVSVESAVVARRMAFRKQMWCSLTATEE